MALFFTLLLAFGVLLEETTSAAQALIIVYALLLCQSLIIFTLQSAILGSNYPAFFASMGVPAWIKKATDIVLSLMYQALLWLNLVILFNIDLNHFWQAITLWQLLLLQILTGLLALYRNIGLTLFLIAGLASFSFSEGLTLFNLLNSWIGIGLLCFLCRKIPQAKSLPMPGASSFWLQFCLTSPATILIRLGFTLMILLINQIFVQQRADLVLPVYLASAHLVILLNTSLQLDCRGFIQQHLAFFNSYFFRPQQSMWRFAVSGSATLLGLLTLSSINNQFQFLMLLMPAALVCIYWVDRHPKYFSFIWLVITCATSALIWMLI